LFPGDGVLGTTFSTVIGFVHLHRLPEPLPAEPLRGRGKGLVDGAFGRRGPGFRKKPRSTRAPNAATPEQVQLAC
jgi:hypothetical protein